MLIKRTIVKPSKISGLGCFIDEPVDSGEVLWKFDPRFDILLSQEEVDKLPIAMQEFVQHFGYFDRQQFSGWWVLHSGNDRFCNHSDTPTLKTIHQGGSQYVMVASRSLIIGDELTCNYNEYEDRFKIA